MKTPQEKANELVKRMYLAHSNSVSNITQYFAIQCAKIAVEEILNVTIPLKCTMDEDVYWSEVLDCLNKM